MTEHELPWVDPRDAHLLPDNWRNTLTRVVSGELTPGAATCAEADAVAMILRFSCFDRVRLGVGEKLAVGAWRERWHDLHPGVPLTREQLVAEFAARDLGWPEVLRQVAEKGIEIAQARNG